MDADFNYWRFLTLTTANCIPLNSFLKGNSCIADDGRTVRYGIRPEMPSLLSAVSSILNAAGI